MNIVIFRTENAVFQFDQIDATEHLNILAKDHDMDEVTKLLELISAPNEKTILIPENDDYFGYVALDLISTGIGFGATFLNGTNALAKNTIKYLKKLPASMNRGLLQKFLSGKVTAENGKKIYELLKKTNTQSHGPYPAYQISEASNILIPHQI